jgi:hypothetical protein
MFTPTQKELDQLWFTNIRSLWFFSKIWKEIFIKRIWFYNIRYTEWYSRPWSIENEANDIEFYPRNINDVCTIINIFDYEIFVTPLQWNIVNDWNFNNKLLWK